MRFSGGEMVFHRLEIKSKAMNVVQTENKSIRKSIKTPEVVSRGAVRSWDILGIPRLGMVKPFLNFDLKRV